MPVISWVSPGAIDVEAVKDVISEKIGKPLGLDATAAAAAIVRIADDKMAGAIRMVSLARGHDPRDFVLFAFGGAGPLHAAALARELGIPRVLIPARPGITNALGCMVADLRRDYVNTVNQPVPALDEARVERILSEQVALGRQLLEREGVALESVRLLFSADMQFQGQSHILTVPLPGPRIARAELQALFERAYFERFGVELPEIRAVLVNLHTAVIGVRPHCLIRLLERGTGVDRGEEAGVVCRRMARDAGVPAREPAARVSTGRRSSSSSIAPRCSSRAIAPSSTRWGISSSP